MVRKIRKRGIWMYICIYIRAQVFARVRAPRADPSNHSSLQGRDLNVTKYKLRYFKVQFILYHNFIQNFIQTFVL